MNVGIVVKLDPRPSCAPRGGPKEARRSVRVMTQFTRNELKLVDKACRKLGIDRAAFLSQPATQLAKLIVG